METLMLKEKYGNEREIKELRSAIKETKSVRMHKRYSAILMHYEGFTNKKIAEIECLEEHAVGNYIKAYKSKGLEGLKMGHSTGAKRKLNSNQTQKIVEVVTNSTPDKVGFEGRKNWTIELIRQWVIKEFNVTMSHRGMAEVLYRNNLSYTRPTYVMEKADKNKQEKFKEDFETLKKTP